MRADVGRFTLVAFMLMDFAAPSFAGWGRGSCGPVGPSRFAPVMVAPVTASPDGWQKDVTDLGSPCWIEWHAGQMARAYIPHLDAFRVVTSGKWQAADVPDDLPASVRPATAKHCKCGAACCKCKEPCPCKSGGKPCCPECKCKKPKDEEDTMLPADEPQEEPLTGVDSSRMKNDGQERFIIDGKQVSRKQYMQLIEGGQIPDDANKLRLTVIGAEADRNGVLKDLASATPLSAWAGKLVVQDYAPADWAVANAGFVTGGKPTIYLQQPDGKVLLRMDQYDGPQALAEAIRKADPNYKPDQDPSGKPSPASPASSSGTVFGVSPWALGVLGLGIVATLLFRKR